MLEIFMSDIHFPYEDKLAWPLALKIIKDLQPDLIYLGGDILDCYAVSAHDKDPKRSLTFDEELTYARKQLGRLTDLAPKAKIKKKEGNHEDRMPRLLRKKAPELAYLDELTLPRLLDLKGLGIEWVPNSKVEKIGHLYHLHGNEVRLSSNTQNIALAMYRRFDTSIIFGHYHRLQRYSQRRLGEHPATALANPCLCDFEVPYDLFPQWQSGLTVIDYSKSGFFQAEQVNFLSDTEKAWCGVQGKGYTYKRGGRI